MTGIHNHVAIFLHSSAVYNRILFWLNICFGYIDQKLPNLEVSVMDERSCFGRKYLVSVWFFANIPLKRSFFRPKHSVSVISV